MHNDSLSFLPYIGFIIFAVLYVLDEDNLRVLGLFNKLDSNIVGTGLGLAIVKRVIEVHKGNTLFFALLVKDDVSS